MFGLTLAQWVSILAIAITGLLNAHPAPVFAQALTVLKQELGDDTFSRILKEWSARNDGIGKTTEDFLALAKDVSGVDLEEFASAWLYGDSKPLAFTLSGK